jgi:hypothetical protein
MQFHDPHMHRLLAEDRATDLRRAMGVPRAEGYVLTRVVAALRARRTDRRRPECYRDRPAAAGLPR